MIFNKRNNSRLIEEIYQNIIERSRLKYFYLYREVEDTLESRFDLIIFHSFIIFQFFREKQIKKNLIQQNLFDFMFKDFENNLREMGFGDVAVNKKMKVFISAFYGRISNYSMGVENYRIKKDKKKLFDTIRNNVYKNKMVSSKNVDYFVEYLILNINYFIESSLEENIKNRFNFIDKDQINGGK